MRLSLILGSLATANLAITFATSAYVLARLGAGIESDAIFSSLLIPQAISTVLGGSLQNVLLPLLSAERGERRRRNAWGAFIATAGVSAVAAGIVLVLAPYIVALIFPGFKDGSTLLNARLLRIQSVTILASLSYPVVCCFLQAEGRALLVELSGLIAAVVSVAYLFAIAPQNDPTAMAWTFVIRGLLPFLILTPFLGPPSSPFACIPFLAELWRRMKPLLLGATYYKTGYLVDGLLASLAPSGSLSLLYLGERMIGAGTDVLRRAVAVPALPELTEHATRHAWDRFYAVYLRSLVRIVGVAAAAVLAIVFFGRPILGFLFGSGKLDASDQILLRDILASLGGFLIGGASGTIMAGAWYARGDTRTPTIVGTLLFSLGLALKIGGFHLYGLIGIAWAISLQSLTACLAFGILERRHALRTMEDRAKS